MNLRGVWVAVAVMGAAVGGAVVAHGQPARNVTPSLLPKKQATATPTKVEVIAVDKILNCQDPTSLTRETFEKLFATEAEAKAQVMVRSMEGGNVMLTVQGRPAAGGSAAPKGAPGVSYDLRWSERKFPVLGVMALFDAGGSCRVIAIHLPPAANNQVLGEVALQELTKQMGTEPTDGEDTGSKGEKVAKKEWQHEDYRLAYRVRDTSIGIQLNVLKEGSLAKDPFQPDLAAALDPLISFDSLWKMTPEDFETRFVSKEKDESKAQFEWLSVAKERARFSRRMFANVQTKLTMFGGEVRVEEAIVEFVNGRAARATISFYNRGDSGPIATEDFERVFKKIGQGLTTALKMTPRSQLISSNAALKTNGWNWTTPSGIALLEYNDYTVRDGSGKPSKPEFLRLKLAAPDQADWSMGKLSVGVQRMALTQNVRKSDNGDVYIAGVPMVDQGAKGYCVAASCQRLFEYMRIPCDQHEMARLLSVDAESGADVMVMQKSLAKVDGQFRVSFRPLVNPLNYYDNRNNPRVSLKEFTAFLKEHVDKGVPLLWGLALGQFPEEPPLPNGGQVSGGHMRMVIGYNAVKNQVLFTDSWGAGHELKRMAAMHAYEATAGLYSMSPRGL